MELEHGGQRISVAAGECVIGTDAGAAIRLAGASLLPRHAVVRLAGGHLVVQPGTPGAAVTVNGAPIGADPTPVMHGDRIGIGSHLIIVTDPSRSGATRVAPAAGVPGLSNLTPAEPSGRLVSLNDGREYRVAVVPFVLGRDATAQVVIGSPDASRRHAEIVTRPDGDVLVDLSANGTYVNGQRVAGRHPLKALDVIRIGAEEFRYYPARQPAMAGVAVANPPEGAAYRLGDTLMGIPSFPTPARPVPAVAPAPAARPLAHLRIKSGEAKGERFAVRTTVVSIGRADSNEIRLPDASVSSSHARLQLTEGVWSLVDLGSTNGTTVDGLPVGDETPLSPGATIRLGEVAVSFEPQDEPVRAPERDLPVSRPLPNVAPPVAVAPPPPAPVPPRLDPAPAAAATRPAPRPAPARPEPARPRSNVLLLSVAIVVLIAALALLIFVV